MNHKNLCKHNVEYVERKFTKKAECPTCHSFYDLQYLNSQFEYDESYPKERNHFNSEIGRNKVITLQNWINRNSINLSENIVCEVGFGGGFCLQSLNKKSKYTYGIEVVPENIQHAIDLGLPKENLFNALNLPDDIFPKVSLWIFQDSFEHIPDPDQFIKWLEKNSSEDAKLFIVLPTANTFSEKYLGTLWPHRISDHHFHWSSIGIKHFFKEFNFELEKTFYPKKKIDLGMILLHLQHKVSWLKFPKMIINFSSKIPLSFNIGQVGFIFKKKQASNQTSLSTNKK